MTLSLSCERWDCGDEDAEMREGWTASAQPVGSAATEESGNCRIVHQGNADASAVAQRAHHGRTPGSASTQHAPSS